MNIKFLFTIIALTSICNSSLANQDIREVDYNEKNCKNIATVTSGFLENMSSYSRMPEKNIDLIGSVWEPYAISKCLIIIKTANQYHECSVHRIYEIQRNKQLMGHGSQCYKK